MASISKPLVSNLLRFWNETVTPVIALPAEVLFDFESVRVDGVRVGAGVEHQLTSRAFVKAEYRYSNYEQGVSRNQVVAGVGLRF